MDRHNNTFIPPDILHMGSNTRWHGFVLRWWLQVRAHPIFKRLLDLVVSALALIGLLPLLLVVASLI